MPSSTFFNLPEEKREKLLEAARDEFGRVPYEKASINKMIRAADIPRGSFYMYFTDKEDLFRYLMRLPQERVMAQMERTLEEQGGDIFAAAVAFYDQGAELLRKKKNPLFEKLAGIMMKNMSMGQGIMYQSMDEMLRRMGEKVDRSRLELRSEGDLEIMLRLLMGLVGSSVISSLCGKETAESRQQFVNSLDILRRGMEKRPQEQSVKE